MSQVQRRLITYCTNIHPGENWAETFAALREHIPLVKADFSPDTLFPLGLRLSQQAAAELDGDANPRFADWLSENGCYVPTINAFPYGTFHNSRVKEQVYLPDWRSSKRVDYTCRVARLLSSWLPEGMTGSISTVPVGFKAHLTPADLPLVRANIVAVLDELAAIRQQTGREIILALEPEPACYIESSADFCEFVDTLSLPSELSGFLGICLDTCHLAVQFEEPVEVIARLKGAGIRIAKVQASSALAVIDPAPQLLERFREPCYLHQVVIRRADGSMGRYDDLPDALDRHRREPGDEWRCHFHLPLFFAGDGAIGTTRPFLEGLLPQLPGDTLLEVETYTWDVLPPELRQGPVTAAIVRELQWLEARIDAAYRCP